MLRSVKSVKMVKSEEIVKMVNSLGWSVGGPGQSPFA